MKNIFLTIAILAMSVVASARSIDFTPVVATVSGQEAGIKEIALLGDGRLQIVDLKGSLKTIQVSETALKKLVQTAIDLSFAEVKTETRYIVCERLPLPTLSNLSIGTYNAETRSFEGNQTRRVLTAQGCEYAQVISPVEAWNFESATQLRYALIVLALNSLK